MSAAFRQLCSWKNLHRAWRLAARGKRGARLVAAFEYRLEDELCRLREELLAATWRPNGYVHFEVKDPKIRKISAAPFADRVVHHALCQVIEPRFERLFLPDSYANRPGKGTHRAIDRCQAFAKGQRYVLRLDVVQHFAAMDHAVLAHILFEKVPEPDLQGLVSLILESGRGVLDDYHCGRISFGELEASIVGWSAHAAHADSWGLRRHMFDRLVIRPAEHRRAVTDRG